jgi:hypothetical protein
MFTLLERMFQTLKTVENDVAYISHILSGNNIEDGDLDDTVLISNFHIHITGWVRSVFFHHANRPQGSIFC